MNHILKTALAALIAYSSHYGMTKFYTTYCIPDGFWGFIQGSATTGSPLCSGAFTVMTQTHTAYSTILITSLSHLFVDSMGKFLERKEV